MLDGDDRLEDMSGPRDREISLGTTMILGIFFALAVLCAVFFGFGYSLGRKSVAPVAASAPAQPETPSAFSGFKPSPGNASDKWSSVVKGAASEDMPPPVRVTAKTLPQDSHVVGDPLPVAPPAAKSSTPLPLPMPVVAPGGSALVQVAAVSHQEDADLLITTLKRRGYAVSIRSEPQDKLLHVQVGPFATHKEADAMRQRLLADGFNAIVKDNK